MTKVPERTLESLTVALLGLHVRDIVHIALATAIAFTNDGLGGTLRGSHDDEALNAGVERFTRRACRADARPDPTTATSPARFGEDPGAHA
ncbi:hypothetical protein GCM10023238_39610 [Streptomyces heliomycini]